MANKYEQFSKVEEIKLNRRCRSKKGYDTREEAYQKGQDNYKCEYCGKWHRASVPRGRKAKGYTLGKN